MYNNLYGAYGTENIIETTFNNGPLMGMFMGISIFSLIISLIIIISYWKIFKKAGQPGVASIIPIYNIIVMIKVAKLPLWYLILFFIPIANIYALFKIYIEIAKKYGKSTGFGIGMALVPIIFVPMLAFSDNVYDEIKEEQVNNSLDANTVIDQSIVKNEEEVNNQISELNNLDINNSVQVETQINVIPNEITVEQNDVVINDVPVENIEQSPAINVVPTDESDSVVETIAEPALEPQVDFVPNAFNSTPIMTEQKESVIMPEEVNVDNVDIPISMNVPLEEKVIETIVPEETIMVNSVEPQIITEIPNEIEQRNLCKNCGIEMPEIVSVCPNCGTDNE